MMMREKSGFYTCIRLLVFFGFSLTSCVPVPITNVETKIPFAPIKTTSAVQERTATPTAVSKTSNSSRIVIQVGTGESGNALNSHQMVIQAYELNHQDVLVQLEAVAGTDYYARLMALAEANRAPDIMNVGDDFVRFFVDKGMFIPFDELQNNITFDSSEYLPGLLEPGRVNGKQYFLPQDYTPLALYFNKKLFDAAKLPYPTENWTWNDLLFAAQKLTIDRNRDGIPEQWGIQMNANWETGFEYWVAAAGGRLISEDGKKIAGYMDSPETIRALQFYSDLYHKYQVAPPPADLMAWAGGNQEFDNGTAAMLIFGHWTQAGYVRNPKIDLGITSPPKDKVRANILFWNGCGISTSSENPVQTEEFLMFYTGDGNSKIWGETKLPISKSTKNESSQISRLLDGVWVNELSHLVPRAYSFTPYWEEAGRYPLRAALTTVVMDPKADPGQVLKKAAREAQVALNTFQ